MPASSSDIGFTEEARDSWCLQDLYPAFNADTHETMTSLNPKARNLQNPDPTPTKYRYGLVTNKTGTANNLRALASALRSCEEVHCDNDLLNSLLQERLPRSRPDCVYQQFLTWRLVTLLEPSRLRKRLPWIRVPAGMRCKGDLSPAQCGRLGIFQRSDKASS